MIPYKLSLKNFMCYKDRAPSLILDGIHVACICGDNGHGKSALLDAITWALWGEARAKSTDELVSLGQTDMEVELEFLSGDEHFRVLRKHSKGKSGRSGKTLLELHVGNRSNGAEFKAITANTVRESQGRIIDLLRMDYKTFVNSAFLRQGRADEFTLSSPAERKQILSNILGLSLYDDLESEARSKAKVLDSDIRVLEIAISDMEKELQQRALHEDDMAQVIATLFQVDKDEAQQGFQVQELGRQTDLLQVKREEQKRLQKRIREAHQDIEESEQEVQQYQRRSQEYQQALDQRQAVEEGYNQFQRILKLKEDLDRKLAYSNELVQRRGRLERDIEIEKGELNVRRERLVSQVEHLQSKVNGVQRWQEELSEKSIQLASLDDREGELKQQQEKYNEAFAEAHHVKEANDQLMREMHGLRDKVDMLSGGQVQCPLCGGLPGEDGLEHIRSAYEKDGRQKSETYKENQKRIDQLKAEHPNGQNRLKSEGAKLEREKVTLSRRLSVLERDLREAEQAQGELETMQQHLSSLDNQLSLGNFASKLQEELAQVASQIKVLDYQPETHGETRERLETLKGYEKLYREIQEAQRRVPEVQQAIERTEARLNRLRADSEEDSKRLNAISAELQELPELEDKLRLAEHSHKRLQEEQRKCRDRKAMLQESLRRMDELQKSRDSKQSNLRDLARRKGIYEELSRAFGKGGVQALIIETALPEIEEEANNLLGRMTDNRMHVKMETQREKKTGGARETLDINIADELGTRPYELFSGGEAFRINFALRIALSKLLARRAGAPLPILFIDEGFGTQDGTGREKLLEAINSIQEDFERIIVITHIEELKEAFPVRIQVSKSEEGSTFSIN